MSDQHTSLLIVTTAFILLIAVGAVVFLILGRIAFNKTEKGAAKTFSLLLKRGNFLRLFTVVIVLYSSMVLYVLGNGEVNDAMISLLSGIAGFVLGGLSHKENDE